MRACPSGSSAATFINTPIRRMRSACCARAASGQAAAEPAITFMKSRRRITSPKGSGARRLLPTKDAITAGIYDRRNGGQKSFCVATTLSAECPLWVISRHSVRSRPCPLYPKSGHKQLHSISSSARPDKGSVTGDLDCAYREPKSARNGDEVRQGSRVS